MDPTRIDAGRSELTIEITVNPVTKTIAIKENTNDPIMFAYLMSQALHTYMSRRMTERNSARRAAASIVLPTQ